MKKPILLFGLLFLSLFQVTVKSNNGLSKGKLANYFLLFIALITLSCHSDDTSNTQPEFNDPNWIRLEIPDGRGAYAVAGDLNKTLLVSTFTKVYYTTDQGKSWQMSKDFQGPVMGLLVRNDTTFALQSSGDSRSGQKRASLAQYFTTDFGRTWQYITGRAYDAYENLSQPVGTVQASNNITYQVKAKSTPVAPGSTTSYVNPSELWKQDNFKTQAMVLPFPHFIHNLHLDASNRLYVAVSGGTFSPDNVLYCCEDTMPAIIYVSRKPLP